MGRQGNGFVKLHFIAIDGGGRVVRGVLRAESEEEARELMLGENLVARKFEPADENEKVTWAAKGAIKARLAAGSSSGIAERSTHPEAHVFSTRLLRAAGNVEGTAGLDAAGDFLFVPKAGGEEMLRVRGEDVEVATIHGFPGRVLRLTLITGRMLDFAAGFLFASGSARAIARQFRGKKGSS